LKSVPCPKQDHGICTIPDKTAVVKGGVMSIQSRAEIETALPDLDLETATLRPLRAAVDHENLIEAMDAVGTAVQQDQRFATDFLTSFDSEGGTAVVVRCSCGDTYVVDV
jgi:hypothetical protein